MQLYLCGQDYTVPIPSINLNNGKERTIPISKSDWVIIVAMYHPGMQYTIQVISIHSCVLYYYTYIIKQVPQKIFIHKKAFVNKKDILITSYFLTGM